MDPSTLPALPGAVYRTLFAAYPDALLLVDAAGTITLANPAAAQLLGYASEALHGLAVEALVPDAIRPRHAAYRGAYAHNPRARPMGSTQTELVARRGDGSEVMVEIALSPVQVDGQPYVVAAVRGVEDYPRVQQALRRARYAELVAQVGHRAVDVRDPHELVELLPQLAAEVLRADAALVFLTEPNRLQLRLASGVGLAPGETLGMRMLPPPRSAAAHVLASGEAVLLDDLRDETHFAVPPAFAAAGLRSALLVPITDRGHSVGLIALRSRQPRRFGADERGVLESLANVLATSLQRAHSEEALSHAQRLESVGQLSGGIAHDFNNLLTVILGNLQVLQELPEIGGGDGKELVDAALRAGQRGAELTGKLLAFSRRQLLQTARVDVATLLESLSGMLRRTLDQRIRIAVEVAPDCPPVRADPGQLESALLTIAINARDAMPDGGLLSLSARPAAGLPDAAGDTSEASYVAIAVADSGSGMSEQVRERAFEPFFTTKDKGRGTGLGLSTVYGFVKQSSGGVEIDSAPGRGTTVTLVIPRWRDAVPAAATDAAVPAPLPAGLQVLLVEDDAAVSKVVRGFLTDLGCAVAAAATGEQALAMIDDRRRIDLLLIDIALGAGMRGTELAQQSRARQPQLAVLLMSGFAPELLDAEPQHELLRKPYTREQLARAITRALQAGR